MAQPQGISRANFLSASASSDGIIHSIAQKGGYQEVISAGERNSIPLFLNGNSTYTGFTLSDDIWSSGRRRVGMMVHVVEDKKFYNLIPVGFFGNGGDLGMTDWLEMSEWERALRIDPAGTYCSEGATPSNNFTAVQKTATDIGISNNPSGCWLDMKIGDRGTSQEPIIDGHIIPDTNEAYDLGSPDKKFRDIYMSGNTLYMGGQPLSIVNGALTLNGNPVTGSTDTYNSTKISEGALTSSQILEVTPTSGSNPIGFRASGATLSPTLDRVLVLDNGEIKVFRLINNSWQQEGSNIPISDQYNSYFDFNNANRRFSADGTHFIYIDKVPYGNSAPTVFYWDGTDWAMKGNQITLNLGPELQGEYPISASSVDINQDGTRISIGWRYDDNGNITNDNNEYTMTYIYDNANNMWKDTYQLHMTSKYHNMDPAGEFKILYEDGPISSRRIYFDLIDEANNYPNVPDGELFQNMYSIVYFNTLYTGNDSGTPSYGDPLLQGVYQRGDFSGDGNIVSIVDTNAQTIRFQIKRPQTDPNAYSQAGVWWLSSTLDPSSVLGSDRISGNFCHNYDGTKTLIHSINDTTDVHSFSIWERSGTVGNYSWSLFLGPIATASKGGFSANVDLTKVIAEISESNYVLYDTSSSFISVPANRILDMNTLSVGSQFELQFDEGLAYAAVQTCHVYIDYNNRIHARVVSNDASTNILTLEVIELVGGGTSDEYTITLG
jgi:hypothetical protein